MTPPDDPADDHPRQRLVGLDLARGLALAGMMAVHLFPALDRDGSPSLAYLVSSGRASALFAVLAGVGLALGSGGPAPPERLGPARRAIVARCLVILAVGLTLGAIADGVALILTYYAVLFLLALPVLGWGPRRLGAAAVTAAVAGPVLSQVLRLRIPDDNGANLGWSDLADPLRTLATLLVTGYYPVLTWAAYLFAGLAVGRLELGRAAVATRLTLAGAGLAAGGRLLEAASLAAGGTGPLADPLPGGKLFGQPPDVLRWTSLYGTTPTGSWWWLGTAAPHSGAAPDLVTTAGSALLVTGLCLLTGRFLVLLRPLAAAGAMTLTLYSVHVVVLSVATELGRPPAAHPGPAWAANVLGAVILALVWGAPRRRGPLEKLAAGAASAARRPGREQAPA
jgi:uncharacterized membrane protein